MTNNQKLAAIHKISAGHPDVPNTEEQSSYLLHVIEEIIKDKTDTVIIEILNSYEDGLLQKFCGECDLPMTECECQ